MKIIYSNFACLYELWSIFVEMCLSGLVYFFSFEYASI